MNKQLVKDFIEIMPLMHRKFFHSMRKHDLKKYTMALMNINDDDGQPMNHYCEKLMISKPNFTKVVNELIDLNFVERKMDSADRRKTNIFITESGKKEVKIRKKYIFDLVSERLSKIPEDELDQLHDHVLGIHAILEKI